MQHFFPLPDARQHRAPRLPQPPVLPLAPRPPCAMAWIARRGMAAGGTHDHHRGGALSHQPLTRVRRALGGGTGPPPAPPLRLEAETEWAPHQRALLGPAWTPARRRAAGGAPGGDHLDARRVDDAEHGRRGPEDRRPGLMRPAEAQEPCPRGPAGAQGPRVAGQPASARPVADAFERMPPPQGDDRPGPEVGLGGVGEGAQLLIDLIDQGGEQIYGGHVLRRAWRGGTLLTSLEEVYDHDHKGSKI